MFTWNCPSCSEVHVKSDDDLRYIDWRIRNVCAFTYCPKSLVRYVLIIDPVTCLGCGTPWMCKYKVLVNAT